ncbi:DUF6244 family protein [Micromonospora thermarum]|uniref:Uncharacterized protein n=1 Tax=Micromonospora thermarum TaxID=2720024 RepID=A0ABX0ZFB3_9ACTN|nr:DUF6244 family protein [Micromonospora thermarum]NJP35639.1 hypothetical protein [Micromonospora thermarum]
MSHIEKITAELRTLSGGVERAQALTATADQQAQEVARRAAGAGFAAVAAGMTRVRGAIATVQGRLSGLATSIGEATTATAAVPREATPEETVAGLGPVRDGIVGTRAASSATISQVGDAQRLVTLVLQGGQPGPLLQGLEGVKQVLVQVVQRTTAAERSVEAAVAEARRTGAPGA